MHDEIEDLVNGLKDDEMESSVEQSAEKLLQIWSSILPLLDGNKLDSGCSIVDEVGTYNKLI